MANELDRMCTLLAGGDAELQIAVARVLRELKPKDAGVRKALAGALKSENEMVRMYALEALAAIDLEGTLPSLVPLLGGPEAIRARIQGVVVLGAIVPVDGTPSEITIVRSLDSTYGLDEQAIAALKQWKFEPGMKEGKPVAVRRLDMTVAYVDRTDMYVKAHVDFALFVEVRRPKQVRLFGCGASEISF